MINTIFVFVLHVFIISACGSNEKPISVNRAPENIKASVTLGDSLSADTMAVVVEPENAAGFVGKNAIIKGKIADVFQNDKVAYLNFNEKFPKNPFTAVIFAAKFEAFGDVTKYEGKTVEVTGKITEYKGKPQIVLDDVSQIKIAE